MIHQSLTEPFDAMFPSGALVSLSKYRVLGHLRDVRRWQEYFEIAQPEPTFVLWSISKQTWSRFCRVCGALITSSEQEPEPYFFPTAAFEEDVTADENRVVVEANESKCGLYELDGTIYCDERFAHFANAHFPNFFNIVNRGHVRQEPGVYNGPRLRGRSYYGFASPTWIERNVDWQSRCDCLE